MEIEKCETCSHFEGFDADCKASFNVYAECIYDGGVQCTCEVMQDKECYFCMFKELGVDIL